MRNDARLSRLEQRLGIAMDDPFGLRGFTDDELLVELLRTSKAVAADPTAGPDNQREVLAEIEAIENEIRSYARAWLNPVAQENLKWRRETWRSAHDEEYELPITRNGEGDEIAVPDVMNRRRALRQIPEIARLLDEVRA